MWVLKISDVKHSFDLSFLISSFILFLNFRGPVPAPAPAPAGTPVKTRFTQNKPLSVPVDTSFDYQVESNEFNIMVP